MNDWLYLLLIPVLLIVIWFWPEQKNNRKPMRRSNDEIDGGSSSTRYHAVTIQPCSHACDAVVRISHKRFLANEVMSLPVAGCDATRCQCTYKHYADRRTGDERRHTSIEIEHVYAKHEHRTGIDRRQHAYQ